jgi:hypothetical protein
VECVVCSWRRGRAGAHARRCGHDGGALNGE